MKRKLLLIGMLLMGTTLLAQAPQKMSYQAVVRNTSGTLVANSPVGVRVSILQGSATGSSVYVETQNVSTNANGLVSLTIGSGNVVSGNMAGIDWSAGPYFMKTETDPTGGTSYSISGTSEMMSVPYAMYAETSGTPGPAGPQGPIGLTGATGPAGSANISGTTNSLIKFTGATTGGNSIISESGGNINLGSSTSPTEVRFYGPSAAAFHSIYEGSTARGYFGSYSGAAEDVDFGTYTGSTGKVHIAISAIPKMTIDNIGNVGIGLTDPLYRLQVNGITGSFNENGTRIQNTTSSTGWSHYASSSGDMIIGTTSNRGTFNGVSGVYTSVSDIRLKKNIKNMENVLSKILLLDAKRYEFKYDNPNNIQSIGFIAQDVQKLFPEMIIVNNTNEGNPLVENQLSMDYAGMSVIAIKAIQEQQIIIEELKARIEALEKK